MCGECVARGFSFFFQAEDGIRDHCVTGVQTCALPISQSVPMLHKALTAVSDVAAKGGRIQIGRASCRERGYIPVVAETLKKKYKLAPRVCALTEPNVASRQVRVGYILPCPAARACVDT